MTNTYTQRNSEKFQSRGVKSTAYMTIEEKVRLVNSVYSNPKKLTIAQFILSHKGCTNDEISDATGIHKVTISQAISEMMEVGVVVIASSKKDKRVNYLSLTDLGKKLVRL
jgi:DNA-binding MarR family transcriptional regulator